MGFTGSANKQEIMKTFQISNVHEKKDFPLLAKHDSGNNQIIYLDHAAPTQKPIQV